VLHLNLETTLRKNRQKRVFSVGCNDVTFFEFPFNDVAPSYEYNIPLTILPNNSLNIVNTHSYHKVLGEN
jgi:hypothetical protein